MAYNKKRLITKKKMKEIEDVCHLRKRINLGCRNCVFCEDCKRLKEMTEPAVAM